MSCVSDLGVLYLQGQKEEEQKAREEERERQRFLSLSDGEKVPHELSNWKHTLGQIWVIFIFHHIIILQSLFVPNGNFKQLNYYLKNNFNSDMD